MMPAGDANELTELVAAAIAIFRYGNTNYAIASHFPDYTLVGNPSVIDETALAHPSDVLIVRPRVSAQRVPYTDAY